MKGIVKVRSFDSIDIGYGLTNECTNKAIRILNG